tara:strand:+ start:62 stop:259 length:198 start_codon:yes stop_codon:yes gene_type:complete
MNKVRNFNEAVHRVRTMSTEELYQFHYGAPLVSKHPPSPEDVPIREDGTPRERRPIKGTAKKGAA